MVRLTCSWTRHQAPTTYTAHILHEGPTSVLYRGSPQVDRPRMEILLSVLQEVCLSFIPWTTYSRKVYVPTTAILSRSFEYNTSESDCLIMTAVYHSQHITHQILKPRNSKRLNITKIKLQHDNKECLLKTSNIKIYKS